MQDLAQANFQMKFDHMLPVCQYMMCHRDVRIELMGPASAQVKCIIRSIPLDIEWEVAHRELKRCLTEEKSRAHSAFKLAQIK